MYQLDPLMLKGRLYASNHKILSPNRRLGAHKEGNYGTMSTTNALELPAIHNESRAKIRHFRN
jgi:hypothetical protein